MSTVPDDPSDSEAKKIIDKFAQYVAKNGPGFEEITRQKQHNNPKFAFLFGGEHADYYRFRLMVEIQNLGAIPISTPNARVTSSAAVGSEPNASTSITTTFAASSSASQACSNNYEQQIADLNKQIEDSENNLKAQKQVLQLQKQARTDSLYGERETKQIYALIRQVGMDIVEFESLIDHMATSGSKDTISNSKKWIFDHCQTDQLREVILTYLLYRVRRTAANDALRLHILYLINDWAHYCQRKKLDNVRQMLSRYVPRLYAYASLSTTLDRASTEKLDKLVGVWEGYKYFDDNCYKQLRNPTNIMTTEQTQVFADRQSAADEVERELDETYKGFEKQHSEFEWHIRAQITELEKAQRLEQEQRGAGNKIQQQQQDSGKRRSRFDQATNGGTTAIPSLFAATVAPPPGMGAAASTGPPTPLSAIGLLPSGDVSSMLGNFLDDSIPKCPYYELPAGMMMSLIADEDCTYKMLNPDELRIPAPTPPSQQLLAEIERFYSAQSVDARPRDIDGWEVGALADFFKRKSLHRQEIDARMREEGKSFKDAIENRFTPPVPLEQTPEKSENLKRKRKSRSRSYSSSRSRSSSSSSSFSSKRSRSKSVSRSRSRSRSSFSRSPVRVARNSNARSESPAETRVGFGHASATPSGLSEQPQLLTSANVRSTPAPLNREQNIGAQLMAKMGWEGRGLGAKEQGIEEPVTGGEVRDIQDQYRGIGSKADIFDEYRKQMSARKAAGYRRRNFD